jgi:hypothetical protein
MTDHDHDDEALGLDLLQSRPVPHPAFRGELRRRLLRSPYATRARPPHLWARIAALSGSGTVLLLLALLGVGGTGPFAA